MWHWAFYDAMNMSTIRKKWLVTGASGQLGREWSLALQQDGEEVVSCTRGELDITDAAQTGQLVDQVKPDVIVNCAAYTKVDQAEVETEQAEAVNAHGVAGLARMCAGRRILLVHYSTDYVFPGLPEHRRLLPEGYPESFPPDPVNAYGRTKWMGEQEIRRSNCEHLIIRTSWLCGKHGGNFVYTMLRLAQERDHLKVVDDQYGCPTFTVPAVHNTRALIESRLRGTFHLSSQGVTTWHDFARKIFELKGLDVRVEAVPSSGFPTTAARPKWSRLDIRQLAGVTGTRILPWEDELGRFLSNT